MHNMGAIVNNTVLNILIFPKRVDLKSFGHKKQICNYVQWQMLRRLIVVLILQYIQITNIGCTPEINLLLYVSHTSNFCLEV